jgi:hypothetical protein
VVAELLIRPHLWKANSLMLKALLKARIVLSDDSEDLSASEPLAALSRLGAPGAAK